MGDYMLASIFLNLLLMSFPFCCYFIYLVYSKVISEKEKILFLDLALLTSFYLGVRFGDFRGYLSFMITIPLFISMYKKRDISSIILIILTSFFLYELSGISICFFAIKYFVIFILLKLIKIKTVNLYFLCEIFFIIFINVFSLKSNMNIVYLFLYIIIYYIVLSMVANISDRFGNVSNAYETLQKITKEKKLYESLFKITHEIKNPLAVCKGYLDMFDINNEAKANKYINIINQEIDRTLLLLKDFSSACKLDINTSCMDINMLLMDVCDEAALLMRTNKFRYDVSEDEIYIEGDYNRLKQVFINILKNAKESLNKNGKVSLWTELQKEYFIIYIKDNGKGISKEDLEKIGTAFYTTKKNGTGLGVCFSREIVEKHGGKLEYTSSNNGTIAKVTLPLNKPSN